MEYKFEYRDFSERENILSNHNDLYLIAESNTEEGNVITMVDSCEYIKLTSQQAIQERMNTISNYSSLDNSIIDNLENIIIEHETNLITGGL